MQGKSKQNPMAFRNEQIQTKQKTQEIMRPKCALMRAKTRDHARKMTRVRMLAFKAISSILPSLSIQLKSGLR